jgi:hypothetical protein
LGRSIRSGPLVPPDWLRNDLTWDEIEAGDKTLDDYIVDAYISWFKSGQCPLVDIDTIIVGGNSLRYWLRDRVPELLAKKER